MMKNAEVTLDMVGPITCESNLNGKCSAALVCEVEAVDGKLIFRFGNLTGYHFYDAGHAHADGTRFLTFDNIKPEDTNAP